MWTPSNEEPTRLYILKVKSYNLLRPNSSSNLRMDWNIEDIVTVPGPLEYAFGLVAKIHGGNTHNAFI